MACTSATNAAQQRAGASWRSDRTQRTWGAAQGFSTTSGPTKTPYSFGLFEFHVSNTATHGVIKAGSERRLCV